MGYSGLFEPHAEGRRRDAEDIDSVNSVDRIYISRRNVYSVDIFPLGIKEEIRSFRLVGNALEQSAMGEKGGSC